MKGYKRIDLNDVLSKALFDLYFVVFLAVNEGDLLPISLTSAGCLEDVVDILRELVSICLVPVRDAYHLPAVKSSHLLFDDDAILNREAPVVRTLLLDRKEV